MSLRKDRIVGNKEDLAFWGKDVIFKYMKKFKYYSKGDKNKEQIGQIEGDSTYIASVKAAAKKNLTLTEFNNLFEVEEIKRK